MFADEDDGDILEISGVFGEVVDPEPNVFGGVNADACDDTARD